MKFIGIVDPANAAASIAGQGAAVLAQVKTLLAAFGKAQPQVDALRQVMDVECFDIAGRVDNALGQRKADRVIGKVCGRCQHHRMVAAAIDKGSRGFFRHCPKRA